MDAWTPSTLAAVAALILAGAQLAASRWRDLGVVTLCVVGAALVLARGRPEPLVVGLVLAAIALAAVAWNRGARRGVGRPGLDGVGVVVAASAAALPVLRPDWLPPSLSEDLVEAALIAVGLTGSVGLALALERPGPRRRRRRWFRRVEVVEQPPGVRGDDADQAAAEEPRAAEA